MILVYSVVSLAAQIFGFCLLPAKEMFNLDRPHEGGKSPGNEVEEMYLEIFRVPQPTSCGDGILLSKSRRPTILYRDTSSKPPKRNKKQSLTADIAPKKCHIFKNSSPISTKIPGAARRDKPEAGPGDREIRFVSGHP